MFPADEKRYFQLIIALVCLTFALFVTAQLVTPETNQWLIKENGLIENASALGYLICVVFMWHKGGLAYLKRYWYFAVVMLSFSARELDFDKRFTEVGVLKSKFLVSPEVSLHGKIIGMAIVLFILYSLFTIVRRHGKAFLSKVFSFKLTAVEWAVGIAGSFLVISKTLDGLARKMASFDIHVSKDADIIASFMEECMELAVPYLFTIAVCAFIAKAKQR